MTTEERIASVTQQMLEHDRLIGQVSHLMEVMEGHLNLMTSILEHVKTLEARLRELEAK